MQDEWTKVSPSDQLVKFAYSELPNGAAFLTAQIAGHEVVRSVILPQPDTRLVVKALKVISNRERTSAYGLVHSRRTIHTFAAGITAHLLGLEAIVGLLHPMRRRTHTRHR